MNELNRGETIAQYQYKTKDHQQLIRLSVFFFFLLFQGCFQAMAQKANPPVYLDPNGKLAYTADSLGNRIPDFSYCGYKAAESPIPQVAVKVTVPLRKGDATNAIQSALDYVAGLKPDKKGFRGAVLLLKGTYEVGGTLYLRASGLVLRGSGVASASMEGTTVIGTGTSRETLINIGGSNDKITAAEVKITTPYLSVGANKIQISTTTPAKATPTFKAGDQVTIRRPSDKKWIAAIGTAHFGGGVTALGWKDGQRDIFWDRTVTAVKGDSIVLDVPLTTALDSNFGGGYIASYQWKGRVSDTGVENLSLVSAFNEANPKDEDHRWMAITLNNVKDAWVRQVNFSHFAGSAVAVFATARRVTVEDCKSLSPVSEIGGQRRNTFFTVGQQCLFQRLYAEYGYHDFSTGFCAPGPNAFVECKSYMPFSFSGAVDSWASGLLFDIVNIDGQAALSLSNRGQDGMGAGWTAANSVFWQCSASKIECFQPPTAQNWAFGSWAQFSGDAYWQSSNEQVKPRSLYAAQLQDRLGKDRAVPVYLMPTPIEASSSPSASTAADLTKLAIQPALVLEEFIDQAASRQPISVAAGGAKTIDEIGIKPTTRRASQPGLSVTNGWLLRGNSIVNGGRQDVQWWTGSSRPFGLKGARAHITRYVPGQSGTGLTDDLDDVTDSMRINHVAAIDHNYGLWYERRRDDHERIRRIDGDVWPPFYELPFARSGKGIAYDGLSKYDLSKYNKWYWSRLKQFADLADQKGLVLLHQNYFQHNIIEAGAHYADFPWRTANNINETGFPEPVPYAGDKRIFMAGQFYGVDQPLRRKIHQAYIRQCLENFRRNTGVIQFIGAEFTGPLHFVQFWIDTIREWEKETGEKSLVALSTTKDVQDSILSDPQRASLIDVIDIRYWHYQADGKTYAPAGGQNLAPRQQARFLKPKKTSFAQVYRAVSEYKQKFPEKAVMYSGDNFDKLGWAAFMAGGSLADIPVINDAGFMEAAAKMSPVFSDQVFASKTAVEIPDNGQSAYVLAEKGKACIAYLMPGQAIAFELPVGSYQLHQIDPRKGEKLREDTRRITKTSFDYKNESAAEQVVWISKK